MSLREAQRRSNLLLAGLLLLTVLLTAGCTSHPNTPSAPPGIILVSADTLGAGHLGLYGYEPDTSPNIDRWAEGAIVFRNAFAQLPGTLPSHMSMMTGLSPRQHGVYPSNHNPMALSHDIPTLAEFLRQSGFRTAGFTEGGYVGGLYGFDRGFEQFNDRYASWHKVLRDADTFLASLEPDEPFFLFLHTYDVHDPYRPPKEYRAMFAPPVAPLSIKPKGLDLVSVNRGRKTVTPDDVDQLRALYDAGIRHFDHQWSRLLEMLKRNNLADRTLLVLTADHGEEFMEHGRLAHETVYNPGIHVPLIIQAPGWTGRRDVQSMVQLTDLPATLLAWTGLTHESSPSGTDLLAMAGLEAEPDRSFAYSESFVDPFRVLVGRVDGRRAKLMVRKPRESEKPVACDRVSGLIAFGLETTIRLRSVGHPLRVELFRDGEPFDTLAIDSNWSTHRISFDEPHPLLLSVIETDGTEPGEEVRERLLRIQCRTAGTWIIPEIRLYDLDADPDENQDVAADEMALVHMLARELAHRLISEKPVSPPRPVVYSGRQRQRLKALGYME